MASTLITVFVAKGEGFMENRVEEAVRRAVATMRDNLGEPLTIDDLARAAIFSKFHFTRVFQRTTGLSPGRFLSAMRLQEAKRLLDSTSLPVTEISVRVGYSSVGTFSSRFKSSVGVSPTNYRQLVRIAPETANGRTRPGTATLEGDVQVPEPYQPIFVGLFPEPILQGMPVRCTVLRQPGHFTLDNVPAGTWHLLAESPAPPGADIAGPVAEGTVYVGGQGPITIQAGVRTRLSDVRLRPITVLDPPVLLALCDAQTMALHAAACEMRPNVTAFSGLFDIHGFDTHHFWETRSPRHLQRQMA